MKMTLEQAAAVDEESNLVVVEARAGSGKTTTLVWRARARPQRRILNLVYNKAMQLDAEKRFPANVTCLTTHALAYPAFGRKYEQAGKLGTIRAKNVTELLGVNTRAASAILKTIEAFVISAEPEITVDLVPADGKGKPELAAARAREVCDLARKLWEKMCDTSEASVPMTHDGYLKLFQLSKPDLASKFDEINLDEAQDSNALTLDLVLRQRCRRILVGDSHQSIYAYRGAVNALSKIEGAKRLYLTHSFRFGDGVAAIATILLAALKGEERPIVGRGKYQETLLDVDTNFQYAHICRTNASVISAAVDLIGKKKVHYVGGVKSYPFERMLDVYKLGIGNTGEVKDFFIKNFGTLNRLEEYAEDAEDSELKMMLKLRKKYGSKIPDLIAQIYRDAVDDSSVADVCLTTAHKSKGLEFEQVILEDDFDSLITEDGEIRVPADSKEKDDLDQAVNLLYVALTRAEGAIQVNKQLKEVMAVLDAMAFRVDLGPTREEIDAMPMVLPEILKGTKWDQDASPACEPEQVAAAFTSERMIESEAIYEAIIIGGCLSVKAISDYIGEQEEDCAHSINNLISKGDLSEKLFAEDKVVRKVGGYAPAR